MLVTLEGIDGSGKTTVATALKDRYPDAMHTAEPTTSWIGDAVRRSVAASDADPLAELFLYTADHAAHLANTIRPALASNDLVISDRYSDSRYAYQGVTLNSQFEDALEYIQKIHEPFTRPPDVTIYLDIDPETAAQRAADDNKFEQIEFLADVRANYERLIDREPDRFIRVDATQPESAMIREVTTVLEDYIP